MNKKLITKILFFLLLSGASYANTAPAQNLEKEAEKIEQIVEKDELLVGYYGRPNTPTLGILGQYNIDDLVVKMKEKQKYYETELDNKVNVKFAFHLIHSLATKDPGRNNNYLLHLSEKSVMKYIKRANKEGFAVIIDLQLGTMTPKEAVQPVLKYLKYDNVHLAIDPEFKIPTHRKYPPGKYIGHIFGEDLNEAQESISKYLEENDIQEKRNLIVHMFHERMLRKKEDVKNYDNIKLVYNVDGHGNSGIKIKIYNGLYSQEESKVATSGFKIFYNADKKPLMTPKQILGFEAIGSRKIGIQPFYINYQ